MSSSIEERVGDIIDNIREQLFAKGSKGLSKVARVFRQADFNGNKKLDKEEFEEAMSFVGVFLKKGDISCLFNQFDRDGDGSINYDELLKGISAPLEGRRLAITLKAFSVIDRDGSGLVDFREVGDIYNAAKHPDVQEGKKTAEEVVTGFLKGFEGGRGPKDGKITSAEFLSYYKDLSASIPSEEYYVQMMESVWMIREVESAEATSRLEGLLGVLRSKVMEKTKTGKNAADTLRGVFKHFDADESGMVTADEFNHSMERFGLSLERRDTQQFFKMFDTDNSGTIDTNEFIKTLYASE